MTAAAARAAVGLDARALLDPRPTGVEQMVHGLVAGLARLEPRALRYVLFVDEPPRGRLPAELPGDVVVVPRRARALHGLCDLWIAVQMRAAIEAHDLAAFLSPNTKVPLTRRPTFATVHGLEWACVPEDYARVERLKQRAWLALCTRRARGLVTFAEHTAADLARIVPRALPPHRVVTEGVRPALRRLAPAERAPDALARLGVRAPYVLSVCSHEPRKNLAALIRAYARVAGDLSEPHQLVLVGRAGPRSDALRAEARRAAERGPGREVVFTGYVDDAALVQLYNQAALFAYPSRYEGFGLPLIEAMVCELPIVTSDRSATREVAGDAALLVDPDSEEALAQALQRGLEDGALRARLVAAGRARAARCTWDAMAADVDAFLHERLRAEGVPA